MIELENIIGDEFEAVGRAEGVGVTIEESLQHPVEIVFWLGLGRLQICSAVITKLLKFSLAHRLIIPMALIIKSDISLHGKKR